MRTADDAKTPGGTPTLNKALLDTDTYSEVIKGVDPNVTLNAKVSRGLHGVLTVSSVTVVEAVRGLQRSRSFRRLASFLGAVALEEVLEL